MKKKAAQKTVEVQSAIVEASQAIAEASTCFTQHVLSEANNMQMSASDKAQSASIYEAACAARKRMFRSRRSFVFESLTHNIFDKQTLFEACKLFFPNNPKTALQYSDKAQRSAVSGCVYDMQQNYADSVKICDSNSRIVVDNYIAKKFKVNL
jgi:hypothetical protein